MKRSITLSIAALIMATSLGVAAGHDGDHQRGKHGHDQIRKALHHLDLSDEQRDELKTIFTQSKEEHQARHEAKQSGDDSERAQRKAAMKALMDAPEFDEDAARAMIAERQQKQTERQLERMRKHHQVMQVLTAEQRQQLAEMDDKRGKKRRHDH